MRFACTVGFSASELTVVLISREINAFTEQKCTFLEQRSTVPMWVLVKCQLRSPY